MQYRKFRSASCHLLKIKAKQNRFAWKKYSKFDYFAEIWIQKAQKKYILRFNLVRLC
jgi:hypothetical protein